MTRRFYFALYVCNAIIFSACSNTATSVQNNNTGQVVTTFATLPPSPTVRSLPAVRVVPSPAITPSPTLIPASQPVKVAEQAVVPRESIGDPTAVPPTVPPPTATSRSTQAPRATQTPRPTATIVLPTAPPLLPTSPPLRATSTTAAVAPAPVVVTPAVVSRTATLTPTLIDRSQWTFSVTPKQPSEGGLVTIAWDLKGEDDFNIWAISLGDNASVQAVAPGVRLPSTGAMSYILPMGRKFTRFSLTALDQVGFSLPDVIIEAQCLQPTNPYDACQREAALADQLLSPFGAAKPNPAALPTPKAQATP